MLFVTSGGKFVLGPTSDPVERILDCHGVDIFGVKFLLSQARKVASQSTSGSISSNNSDSTGKGKKRAAPPDDDDGPGRKRTRLDDGGGLESAMEGVEEELQPSESGTGIVDVYRHSFVLVQDGLQKLNAKTTRALKEEETRLLEVLRSLPEKSVDLGKLSIRNGVIYAGDAEDCISIPPIRDDRSSPHHDFTLTNDNLLESVLILEQNGRVSLRAVGKVILKDGTLHLQLDLTFSLKTPTIFEPIRALKGATLIQEAQRRFLSYVFKSHRPPLTTPYHDVTNVPFFHASLQPAPALQSSRAEEGAQPKNLIPTLLPFQRRTVGWLLHREGKVLGVDGAISSESIAQVERPFLWDVLPVRDPESGKNWHFNPLTAALSLGRPEEETWPGGILAEEPGLGKTLESIALVMLNPAITRSPGKHRWDPVARIQVKEIQTTLIVTPAALAPQWVDEIALHAPSLKVLVFRGWKETEGAMLIYDGYTNTPISAAEHQKNEVERERLRQLELERRMGIQFSSQSSKKGKGKARAAMESDIADEDEASSQPDPDDWATYVNQFDICIVTYDILRKELDVAKAPVVRPRREVAKLNYSSSSRPRSPLVMCEWYRVIMDEVQMVGGGKTEEMVSLVPRLSSFAVSGTPARSTASDLIHVLNFLRVPAGMNSALWRRLLKPGFAPYFSDLFGRLSVRTMKASVQDELTIPPQTRYIVPITLGRIERHMYDQNVESTLLELRLDARGVAVTEGWELNVAVLRTWIRRLRQICTHPQVGQGLVQKGGNKLAKSGVLKTMEEVLLDMREQSWKNVMDDRKARILGLIHGAQLLQHREDDAQRYAHALEIMATAQTEIKKMMDDIRNVMREHDAKGELLKHEAMKARGKSADGDITPAPVLMATPENRRRQFQAEDAPSDQGKGKNKAREASNVPSVDDLESEDTDLPNNSAGDEHRARKRALQSRLRECYIVQHKASFILGDVYHCLGRAQDEENAYGTADVIRKRLLNTAESAAEQAMAQLEHDVDNKCVTEDEALIELSECKGGIKSSELMEEANELVELINDQAKLLFRWKAHLIGLLTQKLTNIESADGEADGNEYARSLDAQGEADSYVQAIAAVMADRREVLLAERTTLAAHDVRERKLRHTKAAMKAATALDHPNMLEGVELEPEHEVLQKDLAQERKSLHERYRGRAIKSVMVQLSNVANAIANERDAEKILAKGRSMVLRRIIATQGNLNDRLENDLSQLRKTFNERIAYFRRLQELSDSVAEVEWEGAVEEALATHKREQMELDRELNTARARHRYVENLAKNQEEGTLDEDDKCCILCKCDFVRGSITSCAHIFCEQCLREWLAKNGVHKSCPVCRVPINPDQLQRFSIRDQQPEKLPAVPLLNDSTVPLSRRRIDYNTIDPNLFNTIQSMESYGDYGSKIQTLVRHLLYLQQHEPGSKSIVFSAWADSLHIVGHALEHNGIACLRIDQGGKTNPAKKFRDSPEILVLLLHGERENAGLNVTCASRVFLLESVVRHSFEVQAIARIDRMGQKRRTEVYCYFAEDTVEKNILDLAARQGLSLYTKDTARGSLDVASTITKDNQLTGDSPTRAKMKGDMIDKTDDLMATLFPHLFEDNEYLLPQEDEDVQMADPEPVVLTVRPSQTGPVHNNAVAGPSGLRH